MYADSSASRYDARLVSLWCSPVRPAGIFFLIKSAPDSPKPAGISRDHAPSVGNGPGAIAFARILWCAHSTASERVIASTPALAHADGTTYAEPVHAYVVTIERIDPPEPCAIICLPHASVQLKLPLSTMPTIDAKPFGVSFS